jgi:hypothetical protein
MRAVATVLTALACALLLACGGDDDGTASETPFIPPPSLSPEDAVVELDAIIALVESPDGDAVEDAGIGDFELQTRITQAVEGTASVPGLDEVRDLIQDADHVLAREYLHNNLVETLAPPFTGSDTETITADDMEEIDPLEAFAVRGEDFMVSGIFKEAAERIIALWYRI